MEINTIIQPERESWNRLTERVRTDDQEITRRVEEIVCQVRDGGDQALREITEAIDGVCPASFVVSEAELEEARQSVPEVLKQAISQAAANIRRFHEAERTDPIEVETMPGVTCRRKMLPIRRVGLYIPGGSAPLFSTILMLAIPADIAGCREKILCTPCDPRTGKVNPVILYTAAFCGIREIYKLGGAQAVAAMAFGTESIGKVMKIFGPGNRYVMKAKQLVSSQGVAIDLPAGPSEIMILADETARAPFVAADMLSQAEHGPDSQAMLVCADEKMAREVEQEVNRQLASLPRGTIVQKALSHSRIIVLADRQDRIAFANAYAPEHLLISMGRPWEAAEEIQAAGSVFIGNYSPESAGDYASGTNHTLPTMGMAKCYSGIGTDSFMHAVTFQELTEAGLSSLKNTLVAMAQAEGLDAHANAVKIRVS